MENPNNITKPVETYFEQRGKEIVKDFKEELVKADKVATKNLLNSIEHEVSTKGNRVTLTILADETVNFIAGRKRGYANVEELEEWQKVKGIHPKGKQKTKQAAWAMAKTIQKKGIKNKDIKKAMGRKADNLIDAGIDAAFEQALQIQLEAGLVEDAKKSGIEIKIS